MVTGAALCDPEGGLLEEAGRAESPATHPAQPERNAQASTVEPPDVGGHRPHPFRSGIPSRLPADRQPARRRGPDPGGFRPGVPVAVQLYAGHRSRAGCTASPRTSSSTRRGAGSGSGLRGWPMRWRTGWRAPSPRRLRPSTTVTWTTTCRPRSRRSRRSTGPPWSSAISRVSPTRRSPPPSGSSWARCAAGSTAGEPSCAPRSSTAGPVPSRSASRQHPAAPRRPRKPANAPCQRTRQRGRQGQPLRRQGLVPRRLKRAGES